VKSESRSKVSVFIETYCGGLGGLLVADVGSEDAEAEVEGRGVGRGRGGEGGRGMEEGTEDEGEGEEGNTLTGAT
jgi:hypothetical protein